jgi:hypothetical protein
LSEKGRTKLTEILLCTLDEDHRREISAYIVLEVYRKDYVRLANKGDEMDSFRRELLDKTRLVEVNYNNLEGVLEVAWKVGGKIKTRIFQEMRQSPIIVGRFPGLHEFLFGSGKISGSAVYGRLRPWLRDWTDNREDWYKPDKWGSRNIEEMDEEDLSGMDLDELNKKGCRLILNTAMNMWLCNRVELVKEFFVAMKEEGRSKIIKMVVRRIPEDTWILEPQTMEDMKRFKEEIFLKTKISYLETDDSRIRIVWDEGAGIESKNFQYFPEGETVLGRYRGIYKHLFSESKTRNGRVYGKLRAKFLLGGKTVSVKEWEVKKVQILQDFHQSGDKNLVLLDETKDWVNVEVY